MKKGIDAVISTIILLIIAVAIVGLAYAFISGYFGAVTGSAVLISGASSCDGSTHGAIISIRNVGTQSIATTGITITRTSCSGSTGCTGPGPTWTYSPATIPVGTSGTATETAATGGTLCGTGDTCVYEVNVGGTIYTTRANCA